MDWDRQRHPGFCPHCQAELPDGGRFCVMCGNRVAGPTSSTAAPGPGERSGRPAAGRHDERERDSDSGFGQGPSARHAVRDSSPDRRVYTSPLGHVVPAGLPEAVSQNRARRSAGSERGPASGASGDEATDEPPTRRRRRPTLLREVLRSVMWAAALSTLGGVVALAVYSGLRHGDGPSSPAAPPVPAARPAVPAGRPAARPAPRPSPPSPAAVPPAAPAARDLVITVPAGRTAGAPPGPVAAPSPAPAAAPVDGGVRAPAPIPYDKSLDDIEFVASTHSPQVRACYDRAFRHAGTAAPAGRIELSFVLVDTGEYGHAVDIVTELNLLGDAAVAACLEERLSEWHFPRPPASSAQPPRRLRYPFVFTPARF